MARILECGCNYHKHHTYSCDYYGKVECHTLLGRFELKSNYRQACLDCMIFEIYELLLGIIRLMGLYRVQIRSSRAEYYAV